MLPEEYIHEIRDSIKLSRIISRKVKLTKKGKSFLGLCPFHNEKTPSFNVNDDDGYYHCFGCGAHGDNISFIRTSENKSFMEAVETLAEMSGRKLPKSNFENSELYNEKKILLEITELSAQYFSNNLISQQGTEALRYLKSRGLNDHAIKKFRIGFATDFGLKNFLSSKGFSESLMLKAGMLRSYENNSYQEVFRNRIIYPIFDKRNNVIAFGARALFNSKAKYINSPNTNLFQKSKNLYGISHLKNQDTNTKRLLIVEGYMDVITIYQTKIALSVAPLGTAISEQQIELIWNLNKKPILCLDGDAAGEMAAWRFINRLMPLIKIGYEVSFAWLPKGRDPDEMLRNSEYDMFLEIISNPKTLIETIWDILLKKHDISNVDSRALLWAEAKEIVNKIKDNNLNKAYSDEIYKIINSSRNIKNNFSLNLKRERPNVGRQTLLDSILLLLTSYPKLALDYSEKLVKLNFNNKSKNKILLILLDMIITNENLDRTEFNNHLETIGLNNTLSNINTGSIIKRIGYDPLLLDKDKIEKFFSGLLERVLAENKRI